MASSGAAGGAKARKTWQQTKSENTRTTILDAAIRCFYDLGYARTTTESIAREAGVSRGAMLHHFPTRFELISAAVTYINDQRLQRFTERESAVQAGAQHTRVAEGIDAYWERLSDPLFVVINELKMAARTDPDLAAVLIPALKAYDKTAFESSQQVFPDLAMSEAFTRTVYMTRYLLEGMALAKMSEGIAIPESQMLDWLKRELVQSYQDVLNKVKRSPEPLPPPVRREH